MQLITAVCPAEHREGLTLERMVRTGDRDARRKAFEVGSVWRFPWIPSGMICWWGRWRVAFRMARSCTCYADADGIRKARGS
jgi:hypothetical protein